MEVAIMVDNSQDLTSKQTNTNTYKYRQFWFNESFD